MWTGTELSELTHWFLAFHQFLRDFCRHVARQIDPDPNVILEGLRHTQTSTNTSTSSSDFMVECGNFGWGADGDCSWYTCRNRFIMIHPNSIKFHYTDYLNYLSQNEVLWFFSKIGYVSPFYREFDCCLSMSLQLWGNWPAVVGVCVPLMLVCCCCCYAMMICLYPERYGLWIRTRIWLVKVTWRDWILIMFSTV